jgi:beta-glucosidase
MKRVVEPGEFTVMVGPNSQDVKSVKLMVMP